MPITKTDVTTLITDWLLSPVKGMYRIHLSGDDLDGYGAQLVTSFATEHICRVLHGCTPEDTLPKKYIYHLVNSSGDPDDVKSAINDVVESIIYATNYDKQTDALSFLVTGIEHFDPESMFSSLATAGHTIQYIVIDSHKIDERFSHPVEPYRETAWKRFISDTKTKYRALRSVWLRDTSQSCTMHLFDSINLSMIQLMKREVSFAHIDTAMYHALIADIEWFGRICQNISKATMKDWGIWSSNQVNFFSEISEPAVIQFIWNFYSRIEKGKDAWLTDMVDYACNFRRDVNDKIFDLIGESEWKLTRSQFSAFAENIQYTPTPVNGKEILGSLVDWMNDKDWNCRYIELTPTDDGTIPYPAFEMLAQLHLERNTCVDVLIGYNTDTGYAYLRTIKDKFNLNFVAESFGGGGDPKAIEFIYEEDEEEN